MKRMKQIFCFVVLMAVMAQCGVFAAAPTEEQSALVPNLSVSLHTSSGDTEGLSMRLIQLDGERYVMLRDLAMLLRGTEKSFAVGWDAANRDISLTTGADYLPIGGELTGLDTKQITVAGSEDVLYIDGTATDFRAYKYEGANFFKLDEIASAVDFGLTLDYIAETLGIDTTIPYSQLVIQSNEIIYFGGAILYAEESSVSSSGLTLVFWNDSDYEYDFGNDYGLKKESDDGNWYSVPYIIEGNPGILTIAYGVGPDHSHEWTVDWEWLYGKLEPGHYKIIKGIYVWLTETEWKSYTLACEFDIT